MICGVILTPEKRKQLFFDLAKNGLNGLIIKSEGLGKLMLRKVETLLQQIRFYISLSTMLLALSSKARLRYSTVGLSILQE